MSEKHTVATKEFDQNLPFEIERKFRPLFPESLEQFRPQARPIEQIYLSHPDEPFSLRLREELTDDGKLTYIATLKSRGEIDSGALKRLEINSKPLSQELYLYYKQKEVPCLRKMRAEPIPGVVVDFFEDGHIQVESENDWSWLQFTAEHGDYFTEISGDRNSDNQWRAHLDFRRTNGGKEALKPHQGLSTDTISKDIMQHLGPAPLIVHIGGRSGSGKSTLVRQLSEQLTQQGVTPAVLSTDDYHRGTQWLTAYNNGQEWTRWDDPIVYDTALMGQDLQQLSAGNIISRRSMDWSAGEPVIDGEITPAPIVIIEGIYANSPDITDDNDLQYETTTPLATCIGWRLLRDMQQRPEFSDLAESLTYILEQAEPAYRAQQKGQGEL